LLGGCKIIGEIEGTNDPATIRLPNDDRGHPGTDLRSSCGTPGACHGGKGSALELDLTSPGLDTRIANAASNGCGNKTLVVPGKSGPVVLLREARE
jgi:hypothetical protein